MIGIVHAAARHINLQTELRRVSIHPRTNALFHPPAASGSHAPTAHISFNPTAQMLQFFYVLQILPLF
jgi:hypothetical protein